MSEANEDFLTRKAAWEQQTTKVRERLETFHEASRLLSEYGTGRHGDPAPGWQWVAVIGSGNFPSRVIQTGRTIDADALPTGKEIGQLLSDWHVVDLEYRQAWKRLSAAEQEQLQELCPERYRSPKTQVEQTQD